MVFKTLRHVFGPSFLNLKLSLFLGLFAFLGHANDSQSNIWDYGDPGETVTLESVPASDWDYQSADASASAATVGSTDTETPTSLTSTPQPDLDGGAGAPESTASIDPNLAPFIEEDDDNPAGLLLGDGALLSFEDSCKTSTKSTDAFYEVSRYTYGLEHDEVFYGEEIAENECTARVVSEALAALIRNDFERACNLSIQADAIDMTIRQRISDPEDELHLSEDMLNNSHTRKNAQAFRTVSNQLEKAKKLREQAVQRFSDALASAGRIIEVWNANGNNCGPSGGQENARSQILSLINRSRSLTASRLEGAERLVAKTRELAGWEFAQTTARSEDIASPERSGSAGSPDSNPNDGFSGRNYDQPDAWDYVDAPEPVVSTPI